MGARFAQLERNLERADMVRIDVAIERERRSLALAGTAIGEDLFARIEGRAAAEGSAALSIRSESPGLVRGAGWDIARAAAAISLLLAAGAWTMGQLLFSRLIARPLSRLGAAFDRIGRTLALEGRAGLAQVGERADEIGRLAAILEAVEGRLRAGRELEQRARANLEREAEAKRSLLLYGKILGATSEGVLVTDLEGNILDANEAMASMSEFSREELVGRKPSILSSDRHEEAFYREMWDSLREKGSWKGEIWDRRKGGEIFPALLTINSIYDDEGRRTHYVGIATEITRLKKTEERLHRLAYFDPLTELPNRALFEDRLTQAIIRANRSGGRFGLLFMDLDRFKSVNDSLGHSTGDALLVGVAKRIASHVRESDTVCRLGGDEFIVIGEGLVADENAAHIADTILHALSEPFRFGGEEIHAGMSIGIALYPRDGLNAEELLKKADSAMYRAKEEEPGSWRCVSGVMDAASRERIEIETRLLGAVERGEFSLRYQPQILAREARQGCPCGIVGAEALLRWEPEPGRVIAPPEFIKVAEDCGVIGNLGEWVIREACREARLWAEAGRPLQVSVNLSAKQLVQGRLPEVVADAVASAGLDPGLLRLEVAESMLLRDPKRVVDIMEAISATGVKFAIDDFGRGPSSLQHIRRLPVDCLKIDRAFIQDIESGKGGGDIVTVLISMARTFGLRSIAEGVETLAELEALRARGCDEIQGYYISEALPAKEFRSFALREY